MSKPWAKYEVNFINHDKFRAITPNAICLWLEGKNYADDKLTDGLLPEYEVKHWRFYGKKSVALLTTSCGLKPGTDQAYAPLWDVVEGFGYRMHNYLDHNECREKALERIAKYEAAKAAEAARKAAWRAEQAAKKQAASGVCPADVPPSVPPPATGPSRDNRDLSASIQKTEDRDQKPEPERTLSSTRARESEGSDSDAERVLSAYRAQWKQLYGHECSLILSPLEQMKLDQQLAKFPPTSLQPALAAYFVTADSYVLKHKHPLGLFVRDPMRFLAQETGPPKPSREDEAAAVLAIVKKRDAGDWST